MPTTSSESSKPKRNLSSIAWQHAAPVTSPSTIAHVGVRMLQAGVIATRPATAPDAAPIDVGLPSRYLSTTSQPRIPAAGAASVFTQAIAAVVFTAAAEPELKPNQPNHSSAAPSKVSGTLCGRVIPLPNPTR